MEINERGLVIHVVESALFESGQATLKPEALAVLDRIAKEIMNLPNQVRVEGHTDDRPITTTPFPIELGTVVGTRDVGSALSYRASMNFRPNGCQPSDSESIVRWRPTTQTRIAPRIVESISSF